MKKEMITEEKQGIDFVIIGLSFLIFFGAVFLILDDTLIFRLGKRQYQDLEEIAQIIKFQEDVRRKFKHTFYWLDIRKNDSLFDEDSLFTGEDSEAQIHLNNGIDLSIGPKSLIVLKKIRKSDEFILDIRYGSFLGKINKSQKLVVLHAGATTQIKGDHSAFTLQVRESEDVHINVVSGNTEIKSESQILQLKKNQSTKINSKGQVGQIEENPIEMISPSFGELIWKKINEPVEFKWDSSQPFSQYKLELAKDGKFKNILFQKLVNKNNYSVTISNPIGTLYWRVIPLASYSEMTTQYAGTASNRFQIYFNIPPEIIYPPQQKQIYLAIHRNKGNLDAPENQQRKVSFSWLDKNKIGKYKIQIAKDNDFKDLIIDDNTPHSNFDSPPLEVGEYFWHVKINEQTHNDHPWSDTASFQIIKKNFDIPLESPILTTMNNDFYVKFGFIHSKDKIERIVKDTPPVLKWNKTIDTNYYQIEISSDQNFNSMITKENIFHPEFEWMNAQPGHFYWRVRSIDILDQPGQFSNNGFFRVIKEPLPAPRLQENRIDFISNRVWFSGSGDNEFNDEKVELNWSSVPEAIKYHIFISEDENFKKIILDKPLNSQKISWKNPSPGNYFWKIYAVDLENDSGHSSEIGHINVTPSKLPTLNVIGTNTHQILQAKDLIESLDGILLKHPPQFTWPPNLFAKKYDIEISTTKEFDKPLIKQIIEDNNFNWKNAQPGDYYFRIRMVTNKGTYGPYSNHIPINLKMKPLNLLTSTHITRHAASVKMFNQNQKEPIKLEWESTSIPKLYEVQIATSNKFDDAISQFTESTHLNYIPRNKTEKIFWKVRPLNRLKQSLADFSQPRILNFENIFGLEIPTPVSPINDESFLILPHLPNLLILQWKKVKSAQFYTLQISQTPDFQNILFTDSTSSTSYLVKQKPPSGRIFWRIRAETEEVKSEWTIGHSFLVK